MLVYLNGEFVPAAEAKVSPFDRGFLFGDGIYEVTPFLAGKFVAFSLHLARMKQSMKKIALENPLSDDQWLSLATELLERNNSDNAAVYFHVTRGNDGRRYHGFPSDTVPTVFCMLIDLPGHDPIPDARTVKGLRVCTDQDIRWRKCDIKSTSLLGNVLHFQTSYSEALDETILFNDKDELTEASCSNVFIVLGNTVATPPLDSQKLPGISRHITLQALNLVEGIVAQERVVTRDEVRNADEVWITNSGRQIAPVVVLDQSPVGDGQVGPVWEKTARAYDSIKFKL